MAMEMIVLLFIFQSLNGQNMDSLYFPDDNETPVGSNIKTQNTNYEQFLEQIISGGISKLTLAINKALSQNTESNSDILVFSPLSIAGALAIVLLGSNGKTYEEITSVMDLPTGVDIQRNSLLLHGQYGKMLKSIKTTPILFPTQQINFSTAVFVQNNYPIRSTYKKAAKELYGADIVNVNFQVNPSEAQRVINSWASEKTKRKIINILNDTPSVSTKVIITSILYFKAEWEHPFFSGLTTRRPFYMNGRKNPTNMEVEMMANGGNFRYFRDPNLNCEVMGFPYKGNASTMYVVMPVNSNMSSLKELQNRLTSTDLQYLADSTIFTKSVVLFPKMKIEKTVDLRSPLEHIGVKSLFQPNQANLGLLSPGNDISSKTISKQTQNATKFSFNPNQGQYQKLKIDVEEKSPNNVSSPNESLDNLRLSINEQSLDNNYQNPGLYVDKVVHKVYMDITESGTEAAAATSLSLARDGGRIVFRVDVPFFLFIRHEQTKLILFWGSINAPTPNFRRN